MTPDVPATFRPSGPQIALLASVFLAAVSGGQVPAESQHSTGTPMLLGGLTGDPAFPLTTVFLVGALVVLAGVLALLSRRVVQFPSPWLLGGLGIFVGLVTASVLLSSFMSVSLGSAMPWLVGGLGFLITVMVVGRRVGPRWTLAAAFAGGVVVAVRGVLEYGEVRAADPSWRIFAGWVNPNATAALLMVALFCGLAILPTAERLGRVLTFAGLALLTLALLLTQSRGALLATGAGALVYVLFGLAWLKERRPAGLGALVALGLLGVVMGLGLSRASATSGANGSGTPIARVAASSEAGEQSAGFRRLLWQGSAQLVRTRPIGYGIGTYRFESARPGLTTQTVYAHNAYLQLAAEAGVPALLALIASLIIWFRYFLAGSRRQGGDVGALKTGLLAAVTALLAHSFVDSDLYYFGLGFLFFVLLGVGQLLSTDGVSPEFVPRRLRTLGQAALLAVGALVFYPALAEASRADARALTFRDPESARLAARFSQEVMPFDGEARYLAANLEPDPVARLAGLRLAAEHAPSTRNLRALARAQADTGDFAGAVGTLERALKRDPNNLPTLTLMLQTQRRAGDEPAALLTAERLVQIEGRLYFQVRSLPELIPTDTYAARLLLARAARDPKARVNWLAPAVQGYRRYADLTWPVVLRLDPDDPTARYADQTRATGQAHLQAGGEAATMLAQAYRELGDAPKAREAEAEAAFFRDALAK